MRKVLVLVAATAALSLTACGGASAPPPASPTPTTAATPAADPHGFEADEYIITYQELPTEWSNAVEGRLAKMEKPGDKPGEKAVFLKIAGGPEMKTTTFWKTKPATKADLKPGAAVTYFRAEGIKAGEPFPAPKDPETSRKGYWVVSHVTDVAELDKDVVKIGQQPVAVGAVRVLIVEK